jgi:GLPGLI family protein
MKKLLFLLLFCAIVIQGNAQRTRELPETVLDQATVTVYYRFTQQASIGTTPVVLTDTTVLRIGSIYSVYYDRSAFLRDSVYFGAFSSIDLDQLEGTSIYMVRNPANFDADSFFGNSLDFGRQSHHETIRIFKNRQTNVMTSIDGDPPRGMAFRRSHEMFLVEETVPPQEWTIFPDTMTVLNYLCFKATTEFRGRRYIAWFTPDIPINEGPWKIYGLPGLILRLEDEDRLFLHEAIGLTSHTERPIVINEGTYTIATNNQLQRWTENRRSEVYRTGVCKIRNVMAIVIGRNELSLHQREIGD